MITREIKSKILERFEKSQEKMLISNVLDKAYRFEKTEKLEYTSFLNLNEYNVVSQILDYLKIAYETYIPNKYSDKKVIFFIPSYIPKDNKLYSEYITCLKIIPNVKGKLQHKDFMGCIYNLGVKREVIGDIFVINDTCYFFLMNSIKDYILTNLTRVGNQEVNLSEVKLDSDELQNINVNIVDKEYIVPSLRVDAICSTVFNLSRNEIKEKIVKGDMCINDKVSYYPSDIIKEDDIISLRRCGKIVIKEQIRNTKSGNIVLNIGKFS